LMSSFDAGQRRTLEESIRSGTLPACPACGARLDARAVDPPVQVAYVRRRLWLVCPGCKRTASLDVRGGGPP
jgi:hypothetical protein